MCGYKEAEIICKSISGLNPPYLQQEENTIINEIKAGRTVAHYQTIRLTKSGKEVPISLTISPMRNKAGQIIGASKIARDISDKIHREQTIQFHAKKLETLHAIGKIITEKLDTHSLIQTVINSTTHLAAADVGICFYRGGDELGQSKLSVAAMTLAEGAVDFRKLLLEDGLIHTIFIGESSIKFDNVAAEPHIQALFDQCAGPNASPVRHSLAIPIRSADKLLIGAMFFGYAERDVFQIGRAHV